VQPQTDQGLVRPPGRPGVGLGRLAHEELPAVREETPGALGQNGRRPERAGDDGSESAPQVRVACQFFRSTGDHVDAGESEFRDRDLQEVRPATLSIDEEHRSLRQTDGEHQPGDAAAGPEIQDRPFGIEALEERAGVGDVWLHRSGPQETQLA
jgi:hypothetical protein